MPASSICLVVLLFLARLLVPLRILTGFVAAQASNWTLVDDSSPQIVYSGQWESRNGTSWYNGTSMLTVDRGANASFTFEGIQVSLNGSLSGVATNVLTNITLDNGAPQAWIAHDEKVYVQSPVQYTSSLLPSGQHTITVINVGASSVWLDLFNVTLDTNSTPSSSPTPEPTHEPTVHFLSNGAIVAMAIALTFVTLLIVSCLYTIYRRSRRTRGSEFLGVYVSPFDRRLHSDERHLRRREKGKDRTSSSQGPSSAGSPLTTVSRRENISDVSGNARSNPQPVGGPSTQQPEPPIAVVRRSVDAGVTVQIEPVPSEEVATLPPAYDEAMYQRESRPARTRDGKR